MELNLALKLTEALVEGFAWGAAAKSYGNNSKLADLDKYAEEGLPAAFRTDLLAAFQTQGDGPELMAAVDEVLDKYPAAEDLREYLADLVALHLISVTEYGSDIEPEEGDENDDEFDDSDSDPRWAALEMLFETRGTEVLHVLSYLRECKELNEEPSLEDFLQQFVLDEDDESQDDIFVYEELIKQADLVDGTLKQVLQVGNAQRDENMRDLFTPLMLFFREREPKPDLLTLAVLNQSALPAIHSAILRLLNVYWASPL